MSVESMRTERAMKAALLLLYYFGGTASLFIGAYLAGGPPYLLIAIGLWGIASAFADRSFL